MAENKDYLVQEQENGSILISEEVIASIASLAVREVEGVYGLSMTQTLDLSNILGKKNLRKGIRVAITEEGVTISCNLIVKMGSAVMTVAQSVQTAIADEVAAMTGVRPLRVNVNVCGVAVPKTAAKK
ncbi:MAG: Asp23/Gls24 family envelope stress response protein [Faecousia sp.]|nr:Asp23/Gls24 family envelope stress response protein [Bacillota bacterium]